MTADGYTLRAGTAEDHDEIYRVLSMAFNDDPDDDERDLERMVYEPDRAIVTLSGGELAGVAGAFTRELSVPGAVLPAGHVTMVGVDSAHRRRGVLSRMMHHQLADIRRRGESLAALWASEGRIYQRFGYGQATRRLALEIEHEVRLREAPPPGGLRSAVPTEVSAELQKIYDRVRATRVGWSSRDGIWWEHLLMDIKKRRRGGTKLRALLHEGPGGVDGYALWRVRGDWTTAGPKGALLIREVAAENTDAYRALWHQLLGHDLTRKTEFYLASIDEPVQYLVDEPRRLNGQVGDGLWVRVVDVPAALAGRRYAAPVDVTIAVHDELLPENTGTWRLIGGPDGARCRPADRPAELRIGIGALGAAYLGDARLGTLAATGQVRELVPGTLAPASAAFGWPVAPSAIEIF
jgi:predicted acetyltransferase